MDLSVLVLSQLGSRLKPQDRGRSSAFIRCPFHKGGQERTPSCKVNLRYGKFKPGSFKCFSCGTTGNWTKLAKELGLQYDSEDGIYRSKASTNLRHSNKTSVAETEKLIVGRWPSHIAWRQIPGSIIRKLHGRVFKDEYGREKLYLPCNMFSEEVGGVNCLIHRKTKSQLAYFNLPGEWAQDALLFFDEMGKLNSPYISIVEGPRDAARMIQYGIPSVPMLGTGNAIHPTKWQNFLALGAQLAIIATDGDKAGDLAAKYIRSNLKNNIEVLKVKFAPGVDPGNVSERKLEKLAQHCATLCNLTDPIYLVSPNKYLRRPNR